MAPDSAEQSLGEMQGKSIFVGFRTVAVADPIHEDGRFSRSSEGHGVPESIPSVGVHPSHDGLHVLGAVQGSERQFDAVCSQDSRDAVLLDSLRIHSQPVSVSQYLLDRAVGEGVEGCGTGELCKDSGSEPAGLDEVAEPTGCGQ